MEAFGALIIGFSALFAALIASAEAQRRSVARGDGLLKMWGKGSAAGAVAMLAVVAGWIGIGALFRWLI
ncbi:hypothetical protein [Sphingomonas sp.]|uniref:hypothetical protein n=1 Tax=Sphingomonas sp. TaxID=28214 RepID=UPI003BABB765